jgi:hypothetical protein
VKGAKWPVTDDLEQNHRSLAALASRLEKRSGEISWLAFAHSGALAGLGPLLEFARSTAARSPGEPASKPAPAADR